MNAIVATYLSLMTDKDKEQLSMLALWVGTSGISYKLEERSDVNLSAIIHHLSVVEDRVRDTGIVPRNGRVSSEDWQLFYYGPHRLFITGIGWEVLAEVNNDAHKA